MSFGVFLYGNLTFAATLLAICLPLGIKFKRKADFPRRVRLVFLMLIPFVLVTYAYYLSFSLTEQGGMLFSAVSVLNYLMLFAMGLFALTALFDEPFWQLLLCAVAAYAGQHIMSNIVILAREAFGLDSLLFSGRMVLFFAIQLFISVIDYIILYFTFIRVGAELFPGYLQR